MSAPIEGQPERWDAPLADDLQHVRILAKAARNFEKLLLAGAGRDGFRKRAESLERIISVVEAMCGVDGPVESEAPITTPTVDGAKPMRFLYTNHRGETRVRSVMPHFVRWGKTKWHPEPQWLLAATDIESREWREFAVKDMESTSCAAIAKAQPSPSDTGAK